MYNDAYYNMHAVIVFKLILKDTYNRLYYLIQQNIISIPAHSFLTKVSILMVLPGLSLCLTFD